jgi:hypothetical protein
MELELTVMKFLKVVKLKKSEKCHEAVVRVSTTT